MGPRLLLFVVNNGRWIRIIGPARSAGLEIPLCGRPFSQWVLSPQSPGRESKEETRKLVVLLLVLLWWWFCRTRRPCVHHICWTTQWIPFGWFTSFLGECIHRGSPAHHCPLWWWRWLGGPFPPVCCAHLVDQGGDGRNHTHDPFGVCVRIDFGLLLATHTQTVVDCG